MTVQMLSVPIGTIIDFAGPSTPVGYLECDGSAVSRTTYDKLFDVIGTTWGTGDGSTTFNLPDLCGRTSIGRTNNPNSDNPNPSPNPHVAHTDAANHSLGEHTGGDERLHKHSHSLTRTTNVGISDHSATACSRTTDVGLSNNHNVSQQPAFSTESNGGHQHGIKYSNTGASGSARAIMNSGSSSTTSAITSSNGGHSHTVTRTADVKLYAHGITQPAFKTPTLSHTITQPVFSANDQGSGSAQNMPPYATVRKLIRAA